MSWYCGGTLDLKAILTPGDMFVILSLDEGPPTYVALWS